MAEGLVENLGGYYSEDEGVLRGNTKIVKVWVEDEFDVPFWDDLLNTPNSIFNFEITPYCNGEVKKGKSNILKSIERDENLLGNRFIACLDSDYNYLIDSTPDARLVISSPFILHTYVYSIENYLCHAKTLNKLCVSATKTQQTGYDIERFIKEYSNIIYPLFMWHLFLKQNHRNDAFTIDDFSATVSFTNGIKVNYTFDDALTDIKEKVRIKLMQIKNQYSMYYTSDLERYENIIKQKGLNKDNCYLYIQGHILFDNLNDKILTPITIKIKDGHVHKIYRLDGTIEEKEQRVNQYKNNTRASLSVLLCCNYEYKNHCDIYKNKLKVDIDRLMAETLV